MKISDATFCLIDCETTRKDPTDPENELIEVACDLFQGDGLRIDSFSSLVYVSRPIPPENSAIHNLTIRDVIDASGRDKVMTELQRVIGIQLDAQSVIPVAYHADFDSKVLPEIGGLWLCAERMAHHLTPDLPNFKLATLRYAFGFYDIDYSGLPEERRVHSAAGDLRVLAPVFFHLVEKYIAWATEVCAGDEARLEKAMQVETLLTWAKSPYKMTKWPNFGKHNGAPFDQIPLDYFQWCLSPKGLTDMDDDLRFNIQREMKRRMSAA